MSAIERAGGSDRASASFAPMALALEGVGVEGFYRVSYTEPPPELRDEFIALRDDLARTESAPWWNLVALARAPVLHARLAAIPQREVWNDTIENLWCLEGMEALLTNGLKGSSYTSTAFLGLIESTGYSAVAKTNTAANITAVGGGSPTNGWNECPVGTVAARGTPSFGTASSSGVNSDLAASAVALSTLATQTIKGCFLIIKSKAGTASTSTVGGTAGALLSAGLFGADQTVSASGTLNVTFTARLTTV